MSETSGSVEPREKPYLGLDFYEEKYGAWFFGRETEASQIITNLRGARLTLLHAESGVGKSSLLRAGVAWRMRRVADDSFARRGTVRAVPVVFSSWLDDPVQKLTSAIRTAIEPYLAGRPEPQFPADQLDAAIGAATGALNTSLLIMLDQFEEYFLYRAHEPTPGRFADELARCVNRADLRANFLIAIREDAYAALGDLFKGRIASVYGNYLHVDYLDRAAAENAIREPLDIYNSQPWVSEPVTIQDKLVEAVLDQVPALGPDAVQGRAAANGGAGGRVATPLLQLVMDSVWEKERAEHSSTLRLSTLESMHGVSQIVDAHLGKALSTLDSAERKTAIDIFDYLVTPSGGKIAESVPDLADRTSHSEGQVRSVLEKLDRQRIVRPVPAAPNQDPVQFRRYEIFHDVLAPSINRAIAVAREARRRKRRIRRLAGSAALLLTAVLVGLWMFYSALSSANAEKLTAEWGQLAGSAEGHLATDPELSARLALEALDHHRFTGEMGVVLRAALPELQTAGTLPDGPTVFSAVFDPADANKVASADYNGNAWIWDVRTGRKLVSLSLGRHDTPGTADAVAFNQTGTEVAVGYADGTVARFNARSGRELHKVNMTKSAVYSIEFVGDTEELAIATQGGIGLWPGPNASQCCRIVSREPEHSISADPANPARFAVSSSAGTVIWTLGGSGRPQKPRLLSPLPANDAEFSSDGSQVVTANFDGSVRVYDSTSPRTVMTLAAGEADAGSAAFSPNGQQIVAGYASGTARVWDVPSRLQLTVLTGGSGGVDEARFSADGSEAVTANTDGTIRLWYAQPRELEADFTDTVPGGGPNPVGLVAYLSADRILSLDIPGHLYVSTADGGQTTMISTASTVDAAAWNRAGTEVVSAEDNGTVEVWQADGANFTQVSLPFPIKLTNGPAVDVEMSPDGSRIMIVTSDYSTIQLRNGQTGQLLRSLSATNAVALGALSPSGQILAGDSNGQVEVWNADGTQHRVLGSPGPGIEDLESNQSGSEFVTASASGVVTLWATRDDLPQRTINACPSPNQASFSPDGSKIVIACADGRVQVFDAATGQILTVFHATAAGNVTGVAFSPDGNSIVMCVDDGNTGSVQVWNAELTNRSLSKLEQIARQRITLKLTPAQLQGYLTGADG